MNLKTYRPSRRELLKQAALSSVAVLAAPVINRGRFRLFAHTATEYSRRAIDLMARATVIDMLGLLTLDFPKQTKWFKDQFRQSEKEVTTR